MKRLIPRSHERKRFLGDALIQQPGGDAPLPARVLDLAQSGLALFAARSLSVGEYVQIRFRVRRNAAQAGLAQRDARIVRSRASADGNVLGVMFVLPLSNDELQLLEKNWVRT